MAELTSIHNHYVVAQQWTMWNMNKGHLTSSIQKPLQFVQPWSDPPQIPSLVCFFPKRYYCYLHPGSLKDCLSEQQAGLSAVPYTDILLLGEPAELNNVLGFVSLILSLISPNSSWQDSCQAISGNKNSLHTSVLIFPLLCLLLKCFSLPLLKKQHCNYWKLCSPQQPAPRTRGPWWCSQKVGTEKPEQHVATLSSRSELVDGLIRTWLLDVWRGSISLANQQNCC